jgi:hypothetical protein
MAFLRRLSLFRVGHALAAINAMLFFFLSLPRAVEIQEGKKREEKLKRAGTLREWGCNRKRKLAPVPGLVKP